MSLLELTAIFPDLPLECRPTAGTLLGVGIRAGIHKSLVYKWEPNTEVYPDSPAYLIPIGARSVFWDKVGKDYVVWESTHAAIAGLAQIGDRRVTAYYYNRLLPLVSRQHLGVSNVTTSYITHYTLRRMLEDDYGDKTPMVIYTPGTNVDDLHPRKEKSKPIEGQFMPPPKV